MGGHRLTDLLQMLPFYAFLLSNSSLHLDSHLRDFFRDFSRVVPRALSRAFWHSIGSADLNRILPFEAP